MNILLIEDNRKTAEFIREGLQQAGFTVDHVADGEDGRLRVLHNDYDAIILDLMLPSIDGLAILRSVRNSGRKTPILILSARTSVDDRIAGLRAGGDDYLTKPFAFSELFWRLQALIRRAGFQDPAPVLTLHDLTLDTLSRRVTRGGRAIELQPREFALLEYLVRNAGRVVTKTMILERVWGYSFLPETNVIESRMSRLRAKVDAGFRDPLIHTIRGVGYVLRPPA